jgi:hypothetical protein
MTNRDHAGPLTALDRADRAVGQKGSRSSAATAVLAAPASPEIAKVWRYDPKPKSKQLPSQAAGRIAAE